MSTTAIWTDEPGSPVVVAEGRPFFDGRESCPSCGYALETHTYPRGGAPDPNGGCPTDEVDAMRRWGLM